MACGWAINLLESECGWEYIPACRTIFLAYAAIGALKFALSVSLSHKVEADIMTSKSKQQQQQRTDETQPLLGDRNETRETQEQGRKSFLSFLGERDLVSLVIRLFILFGLDSFASGLASLYVTSTLQLLILLAHA